MPTINTWISDSDYNKYLVVKQKGKGAWTGFIHNALQHQSLWKAGKITDLSVDPTEGGKYPSIEELKAIPVISEKDKKAFPNMYGKPKVEAKEPIEIVKDLFPQAKEICKIHGIPLTTQGKCLQKGCKYAS